MLDENITCHTEDNDSIMMIRTSDHQIGNLMVMYLTTELPADHLFRMTIWVVRGLNLHHAINTFNMRDCIIIN